MGLLQRLYARNAPAVWEAETRLLSVLRLSRRPVAVQWIVTSACDLHCPHCYSSAGRRTRGELTTDEARRLLIDEVVKMGRPTLVLAGGELLLRRDIPELVEYAASQGLRWAMHTHGLHVPRHRDLFERCPPALAAISLDGPEDLHDAFRGKVGTYAAVMEAVRVLKESGCPEVVLGTTITRDNADRLEEMFPAVLGSGADVWGLHLFAPEGRGAEHRALFPSDGQLRRVAAFARRRRAVFHVELCNEWGSAGADDLYYRDQPFLCGAGRISCVVSATGEVMPCTTTDVAESEGNLRERPLAEIWSKGFRRFREPGHGECSDGAECWLQSRNGNGCRKAAFGRIAAGAREAVLR
ncbi:MAG: radical SAM protein [Nannocystaceae bacterium]